jgi:hypothetical protein
MAGTSLGPQPGSRLLMARSIASTIASSGRSCATLRQAPCTPHPPDQHSAEPRSPSLPEQESCIRRDDLANAQPSKAQISRPIPGRLSAATTRTAGINSSAAIAEHSVHQPNWQTLSHSPSCLSGVPLSPATSTVEPPGARQRSAMPASFRSSEAYRCASIAL